MLMPSVKHTKPRLRKSNYLGNPHEIKKYIIFNFYNHFSRVLYFCCLVDKSILKNALDLIIRNTSYLKSKLIHKMSDFDIQA